MKTHNPLPLTIDNLIGVFDSMSYKTEYFTNNTNDVNRFKMSDYNKLVNRLLTDFFPFYTTKNIIKETDFIIGSIIILNERLQNKWLEKFSSITFNRMYPNIIVKLWETGELEFNIYEFGIIYKFIIDNYDTIKSNPEIDDVVKLAIRFFMNYTFGAATSKYSTIQIDNIQKITTYARDTLKVSLIIILITSFT